MICLYAVMILSELVGAMWHRTMQTYFQEAVTMKMRKAPA